MKLVLKSTDAAYSNWNYFSKNPLKNFAHRHPLKIVLSMIESKRYKRVLDVGCADGILLPTLSQLGKEIYGSDIDKKRISYIKKNDFLDLKLVVDDIQKSSFKNNFFDLVICLETLEHLKYPEKAISEIKRIMKKQSIGVISIPIEIGFSVLVKQALRFLWGYGINYDGGYSLKELIRAAKKKPDKKWHDKYLSHKGFDYRLIIKELKNANLQILKVKYFPINFLGPEFNFRIIIKFTKL